MANSIVIGIYLLFLRVFMHKSAKLLDSITILHIIYDEFIAV